MLHIHNLWSDPQQTNKEQNARCCGCSACAQACPKGAITMQYDGEGFLYPVLDEEKCVECGLCTKVCPIENEKSVDTQPYLLTAAGYTTDRELLKKCTSGGFLTHISLQFIDRGGAVVGVKYSDDCVKAQYAAAESREEVLSFASSKYIQSEKTDIYKTVRALLQDKPVLFVGCPCDVYALKRFLGKDCENLYTCELVCMGVTSYRIGEEYKKLTERKHKSAVVSMNARSKERGWFVPHLEERFANGKTAYTTLFGTFYGYGFQVYNRPSCFRCQFRGTNGAADIRVGDFWGIKETDPYWNPEGVSCIFVRSEKGRKLLEDAKNSGFALFETDYETATLSNMSSYKNKGQNYIDLREKFAKVFQKKGLAAACRRTASVSFLVKRLVPDSFHAGLKKLYHKFVDKR